jgi:hypothetical protein
MEVDIPLKFQVTKKSEAIQGSIAKVVDLKARTTSSKPPQEREQREKTTMMTVERIRSLDEECTNIYEESTQEWTQLLEDA